MPPRRWRRSRSIGADLKLCFNTASSGESRAQGVKRPSLGDIPGVSEQVERAKIECDPLEIAGGDGLGCIGHGGHPPIMSISAVLAESGPTVIFR